MKTPAKMKTILNLTDPYNIIAAMKQKAGSRGVTVCAAAIGVTVSYVSMHIHRKRDNRNVLQAMSNWLGCGVHGIMPDDSTRPGMAGEGKG